MIEALAILLIWLCFWFLFSIVFFIKIALLWNKKMKAAEDEVNRLVKIAESELRELMLIKELNL